jgi:hypothetical protein
VTYGTIEIIETTAGTYTLTRRETGRPAERYRSGIPSHDEAISRARAVAELLHLRVQDRCR